MISFITGSHAYGTPTAESDIDLVVCLDKPEDHQLLQGGQDTKQSYGAIRYGNLNLIIFDLSQPGEKERYERWLMVYNMLVSMKPFTREHAVEVHRRYKTSAWDKELEVLNH